MSLNEIALTHRGEIVEFNPERFDLNQAALDYSIEHAQRIKDWPALEKAVDDKIEEQRKFVAWWDVSVRTDGRPTKNGPRSRTVSVTDATELTGIAKQRVSDLKKRLAQPDRYRDRLLGAAYRAAMLEAEENHRGEGTGDDEWYTPPQYIELARTVLGEIDLDPASCAKAQETVRAKQFFDKQHDGLSQEWRGRVWLNPPYSRALIGPFVTKMVEERSAGRVTAGIMLGHSYTDPAWFHTAVEVADALCFTRGRIKFVNNEIGEVAAPTLGQVFFYFGDDVDKFAAAFSEVGSVVSPRRGQRGAP
jgi:phage N-6-adenine-methyltransferase